MFNDIIFYEIAGKPAIMYGGIVTLICFFSTATIGFLTIKGIKRFPLNWHTRMAYLSVSLGLFHGVLGVLAFF
jgi:hypothetical protein